ncbi:MULTISPECIES: YrrS family protein [unclassified Bacillus (in: firmicutes)]|uniref:YrrS family protein n=1 Tax=unclassified Bacillus (in: firmicutes) TaxID=185979 RepID=UPI00232C2F3E|nr:YrrS family protein [Bacillus sp. BP-3]MDC2863300.1 YrrS family protein [Bacillus sp. BP-3]
MMAGTRFQQKQQRRRQNGILNIAIGIVLLAVVIVAYQLFFTSDNTEQAASSDKKVTQQTEKEKEAVKKKEKEEAKAAEQKKKEEEAKKKEEEEAKAKENEKVSAEKTIPQAKEAYTKPAWKPVGTEQGQSPAMTFQKGSVDWNEMNKAIAYAIDIPVEQLVIQRIGNNGKQKAYGRVTDKQTGNKYNVNIDWVENEGWKPTLVQTLN